MSRFFFTVAASAAFRADVAHPLTVPGDGSTPWDAWAVLRKKRRFRGRRASSLVTESAAHLERVCCGIRLTDPLGKRPMNTDPQPTMSNLLPLPEGIKLRARKFGANAVSALVPAPVGGDPTAVSRPEFKIDWED